MLSLVTKHIHDPGLKAILPWYLKVPRAFVNLPVQTPIPFGKTHERVVAGASEAYIHTRELIFRHFSPSRLYLLYAVVGDENPI